MRQIALNKLMQTIGRSVDSSQPVLDLTNDSRQVKPGAVFIAIEGYELDGHNYIPDAYQAGAIAVIAKKPAPGLPIPQIIVQNPRQAQAQLAAAFFQHPSRRLKLAGITGTNGKTTCTFMLDSIFQAAGLTSGVIGTLYNKVGEVVLPTINTSPDSILCQRLLSSMVEKGVTHAAMEVSSHATVMNRVDSVNFALGAITNFSPDHLDLHKSIAEYARAKKDFFQMLPPTSRAIVNMDNTGCLKIAGGSAAPQYRFSLTNPAADLVLAQAGSPTVIAVNSPALQGPRQLVFPFHPPGVHNLANALLAAAAALALGIEARAIEQGLAQYRGIFRRLEVIYRGEYTVIDDAAHNPANIDAVFTAATNNKLQGLSVVYAIRGSRGVEINQAIAKTLAGWAQEAPCNPLIITSCTDTAGPKDRVLPIEEAVFRKTLTGLDSEIHFIPTLRQAVDVAVDSMEPGKTLLLMGGHPMDTVADIFKEQTGAPLTTLPRPPPFGSQISP